MDTQNRIILLAGCMAEIYIFCDFCEHYFVVRERFSKRSGRLLLGLAMTILLFGVNLLENPYLNLSVFPVLFFVYMSLVFDAKLGSRLVCLSVSLLVLVACEFLFAVLVEASALLHDGEGLVDLKAAPWHLFGAKLLTYLTFAVLKQFSGKSEKRIPGKLFVAYLFAPFAGIGIMMITYYSMADAEQNWMRSILVTIFFFFMMVGDMLLFYVFTKYAEEQSRSVENAILIEQYKAEAVHYEQIKRMDERHDMFLHDIGAQLRTLDEMIRLEKRDSAQELVSGLERELIRNESEVYSVNAVLNAILVGKRRMAEEAQVAFDVYAEPVAKVDQIESVDLVAMLGNLLDNAIQATKQCQESRSVKVCIFIMMDISNAQRKRICLPPQSCFQ